WTSTLPLLLKAALNVVVPVPADLVNVPVLVNVPALPEKVWLFWSSSVPLLRKTAPLVAVKLPVSFQVAAPALVKGRGSSVFPLGPLITRLLPAGTVVEPLPLWVLPDQVNTPLAVKSLPPVRVPLARVISWLTVNDRARVSVPPQVRSRAATVPAKPASTVAWRCEPAVPLKTAVSPGP